MIIRYKKSGGFKQLLKLIETSGRGKQEKFLTIVREEDPVWAQAIEEKMLTLDKIMSWNEANVSEIFSRLNDLTLALCSFILTEEQWQSATKTFSHSRLRNLKEFFEGKTPSVAEQSTAVVNLLTEVRTMIEDGVLRLENLDESLVIDDKIEDVLAQSLNPSTNSNSENAAILNEVKKLQKEIASDSNEDIQSEVNKLRKKIISLGTENHNLRRENEEFRKKLQQIKKLSA
jgi:flagellar motor switch protein FliG